METSTPALLTVPPPPDVVAEVCGVSPVERTIRNARVAGFIDGITVSNPDPTVEDVLGVEGGPGRIVIAFAAFCCDARLLRALAKSTSDAVLIDSNPPPETIPLWENAPTHSFGRGPGAAIVSRRWLETKNRGNSISGELTSDAMSGRLELIDAAHQPSYSADMRGNIRAVFFPVPGPEKRAKAERLLIDATQKHVLDFPALIHAPIEKWIVKRLCRTPITPNQITLGTAVVGVCVTVLYASGRLLPGVALALSVGILDGLDGKLARLKIQLTKAGKGEHILDYFIEMSWWAALAYYFQTTNKVPFAGGIWLIFYLFDLAGRAGKWLVRQKIGRPLDDFAPFDRVFRLVAGRRNIYTWLFALFLIIGKPDIGFLGICGWGIVTAAIHVFRAIQIRLSGEPAMSAQGGDAP